MLLSVAKRLPTKSLGIGFSGTSYLISYFTLCCTINLDTISARDDLIHAELRKVDVPKTQEPNSDLPGLGQFYCLHCDRYFNNASVRDDHYKTKKHKKRCVYASAPVLLFFIMGGEFGIDV
jgi:hypothetical protein